VSSSIYGLVHRSLKHGPSGSMAGFSGSTGYTRLPTDMLPHTVEKKHKVLVYRSVRIGMQVIGTELNAKERYILQTGSLYLAAPSLLVFLLDANQSALEELAPLASRFCVCITFPILLYITHFFAHYGPEYLELSPEEERWILNEGLSRG
jgi:hypothetical protein